MKHLNIIIGIIIIILVYGIYLNINYSKIEGFSGLNNLGTSADKIEKLIETQEHHIFNIKIWDNEAQLSSIYQDNIPTDLEKCQAIQKDQTKFINSCPISIWRASPGNGYDSIGDILTKSLRSPLQENVIDVRKPKSPGAIIEKTLSSMGVAGSILKEPEDYVYVGGFGKDVMIDRIQKNELFNKHMKKITFYINLYNKTLEAKNISIINRIKQKKDLLNGHVANYIGKLKDLTQIEPLSNNTKTELGKLVTDMNLLQNGNITYLAYTPISTNWGARYNKVLFDVQENNFAVDNPYSLDKLINGFPTAIRKIIFKQYDPSSSISNYNFKYYSYSLRNINRLNVDQLPPVLGTRLNIHIDDENEDEEDDQLKHYSIATPPGINLTIQYIMKELYRDKSGDVGGFAKSAVTLRKWRGVLKDRDIRIVKTIGQPFQGDETMIIAHESREHGHFKTKIIESMIFSINPDFLQDLKMNILNDSEIKNVYEKIIFSINDFKIAFPQFNKKDYHRLSIWQPIPPPGFVALGFVFTNDEKDIRPSKQLIKCIPETCVKNFKRRPWSSNEDLIFKYKDATQNLSFYRNPFLGTVVVVDENKQNGIYLNKTPSAIKYRNDKGSLSWDCFDIIPCIKESDYVSSLEMADKNSKQMCKAFRGIENKIYDTSSVKQSILDDETKLNNVLKGKKQYLDQLMGNINSLMSEDELYKLISQGLNRYKMRKDLEDQRRLHGQVADKLLRTRGLEISWGASEEMGKFKDLVKKLVVSQYSKVSETKKDCPVCKIPDTSEFVKLKDLEMCYGCLEDVVRELIGKKRNAGEVVPEELLELENNMK
jgi:hypothetical protein